MRPIARIGSSARLVPVGLYNFTTFTFTDGERSSTSDPHLGPTLEECLSVYDTVSNPWLLDTSFFNVVTQGYQEWTVPEDATYRFTVTGARGGTQNSASYGPNYGGDGAYLEGSFALSKGDIIRIVVGQVGGDGSNSCGVGAGGGGASFVVRNSGAIASSQVSDILLIAAGGGGANTLLTNSQSSGSTSTSGSAGTDFGGGAGGTNGNAGANGTGCVAGGRGGAGFLTGGDALSYLNGAQGGNAPAPGTKGGFGGGGMCFNGNFGGGGGGGYSGGGGGGVGSCSCASLGAGGGGGSYNAGTSPVGISGSNTGSGYVTVDKL